MFHKIKSVTALPEYKLSIEFFEGITKIYDVEPLFERIPVFNKLKYTDPHGETRITLKRKVTAELQLCGD